MKYGRKERGHYKGEKSQKDLTSAKDLTIELPRDASPLPYIRLTN